MFYKKLPAFILFAVAFVLIILSGYQCSTRVVDDTRQAGPALPINNNPAISYPNQQSPLYDNSYNTYTYNNPYRGDEDDDSCPRRELRELYSGKAMGHFEFDSSSLREINLGRSANFNTKCGRIFLKMSKTGHEGRDVYEGSLNLVYIGTCHNGRHGTCRYEMRTGYSSSDARYNFWTNNRLSSRNIKKEKFHAIFEDSYGAYILKIEDIRAVDTSDGVVSYFGAGAIYYKMFKTATSSDVHNKDKRGDCYNNGVHVSQASHQPNRPSKRCWFVNTGPYSCRPEGDLLINDSSKSINLNVSSYRCYSHLGSFSRIDLEDAFVDLEL